METIGDFFARGGAGRKGKRENPETPVTRQVVEVLRMMGIPHWKHWGGPFSRKGVSDLVGTIPGGRALYIEVKVPGRTATPDQVAFMAEHAAAGALTFVAFGPKEPVLELARAGHPAAVRLAAQMYPSSTQGA